MKTLATIELALLAFVLLGLPVGTWALGRAKPSEKRGLGLPRGSIRGMLALLIVGSTINFLLFGAEVAGESFGEVAGVLGALSASVIGFYFGGRTATSPPKDEPNSRNAGLQPGTAGREGRETAAGTENDEVGPARETRPLG